MFGKKQIILMVTVTAAVLAAVAVVLLTLPKAPSVTPSGKPSSSVANAFAPIVGEQVTFTATVLNVREGAVLVHANGALCWVRTTVQSDVPVPTMKIGDGIEVVHNGVVAESYPGQINVVYKIRKLDKAPIELSYTLTPDYSMSGALTLVTETCDLGGAIYYYGLKGMDATVEGQTMNLQHALAVGTVSPQYLLEQAEADAETGKCKSNLYKDGGSKVYRYEDYTILKMNTIDGDKTLYLGSTDLTLNTINRINTERYTAYPLKIKASSSKTLTKVSRQEWRLDYDVYYYGISSAEVTVNGNQVNLIEAVDSGLLTFDELLADARKQEQKKQVFNTTAGDGGSWLCRFPEYTILKMNTLRGDKTLYIGTTDMTMSVISNVRANKNDPLIKIAVSQDEQGKPKRVSTWRTAMETDYVIYFVDLDSVRVRVGDEYRDILDAIHGELIDVDTLRSDLFTLAQKDGTVICADGLRDGISYTETTMRFDGFTVTFTGYQNRREVFFSAPNTGGFTQNAKERIAEESPKYPLSVVENDDPMPYKITKAAWKLNYDVYYTGIDRATVTVKGKSMDLIKAVDSGLLTFDELVEDAARLEKNGLIRVDTIKDGGSKKYRFDGYIIFKKHHMNGDRSLYIEKIR